MNRLRDKEMFLLDMDGTIYIGDKLIPGAYDFILKLKELNKHYVFMTNNSSKSANDYLIKLKRLGLPADYDNIFTSGQAAAILLANIKRDSALYVVGTESLKNELEDMGFIIAKSPKDNVDFVLVGYDTELNYTKLTHACELLDRGVPFYATNPDVVCPISGGRYLPDCATICYMIEQATGKKPFYIGKPRKEMAECAITKFNISKEKAVIVGDRLYTDIACGNNAGIASVLVLSGESTREDADKSPQKPDYIIDSVIDLYNVLRK